jgi:hypothetical protein
VPKQNEKNTLPAAASLEREGKKRKEKEKKGG